MRQVPGVRAVEGTAFAFEPFRNGSAEQVLVVLPVPSDPQFTPFELVSGDWPTASGEVAVLEHVAQRLGVGLGGDLVSARRLADGQELPEPQRVVGVIRDPHGAYADWGGAVVLARPELERWNIEGGWSTDFESAYVALDAPVTPQVRAEVAQAGATEFGPADTRSPAASSPRSPLAAARRLFTRCLASRSPRSQCSPQLW